MAVRDVSFAVEQGQVVGLIGPNGAGKTTLLRMLATLLRPTSGRAEVLGSDVTVDYLAIRSRLGYLPDFFSLYGDLTLRECLWFFAKAYGAAAEERSDRVAGVLQQTGLGPQADDLIRHLSRGTIQRLGVGTLLVHEPALLLLDEPASGLDPRARVQLRDILRELSRRGGTIVISSHILTELSGFCTHIALMDEGRLVRFGEVAEIERQLATGRRATLTVLERMDEAVACLEGFERVRIREAAKGRVVFETDGGPEQLARINTELVSRGLRVSSLTEHKADIESLFMKIADSGTPSTDSEPPDA